jgi:hypothetical protein
MRTAANEFQIRTRRDEGGEANNEEQRLLSMNGYQLTQHTRPNNPTARRANKASRAIRITRN